MAKKKSSKKPLYILLGIVAVLIIAAIIGKKSGVIGQPPSISVETEEVKKRTIIEKVNASGTVQPVVEVKLSPDVAGEITELAVEEGDPVNKGDLLVKIRPDNFQSALERAQANLNQQKAALAQAEASLERAKAQLTQAKQTFERQKKLYEEKVISTSDYEAAVANYQIAQNDKLASEKSVLAARYTVKSSQATVDEASENLRRTTIYSPVDGTVSKLSVELGERVVGTQQMAGTEMMRIANLNNMEVRVDVNENDIIRINIGDTANIEVDSYTYMEKEFKGIVTAIANTANDKASQDAVTEFEVKVKILNSSYKDLIKDDGDSPFRPGMTASVEIMTETKKDILTVPLSSVTLRSPEIEKDSTASAEVDKREPKKEKEVVFIVQDDNTVKMTEVSTGISDFEYIHIQEGLTAGQKVVRGPFLAISKTLEDGDLVEEKKSNKTIKEE
ncbi:RND transporter [Marivirga tractuosa]|uniref:Efflux transporter, RND family, MFP subunit n=1 Tax=Marivirga tractuosa (strain ATCC 23168 / DSM 4126 / NBRC 15989 / NCIMB 1408 / VKM B-1430 / H-43) TaxID=643867 RepID=E4TUA2_MARTH|nr:efflux RND transporter periplasmic adaptor subunit [Marivirga tractuosa]ADR21030.1 efflux transporter, RND family, MFP subunit [Marivirga tractuosa DSM 4126]BDD14515.1 RND transporter [Marivirga tractuosa]